MTTKLPTLTQDDKLLDCKEASIMLKIKPQTLSKWRSQKLVNLPYFKIGSKRICHRMSDILAFCSQNYNTIND